MAEYQRTGKEQQSVIAAMNSSLLRQQRFIPGTAIFC